MVKHVAWDVWENHLLPFLDPFDIIMLSWTCYDMRVVRKSDVFKRKMMEMYDKLHDRTKDRKDLYGVSYFTIMYAAFDTCCVCKNTLKSGMLMTQYNIYCHKKCVKDYIMEIFYDGRNISLVNDRRKRNVDDDMCDTLRLGMYFYGHPHYDIVMPDKHSYVFFDDDVKKLNDLMDFDEDGHDCNAEHLAFFVNRNYVNTVRSYSSEYLLLHFEIGEIDIVDIFYEGWSYFSEERTLKKLDDRLRAAREYLEEKKNQTKIFIERCDEIFESEQGLFIYKGKDRKTLEGSWCKKFYDNFSIKNFLARVMFDIHKFKKEMRGKLVVYNKSLFVRDVGERLVKDSMFYCPCRICKMCVRVPKDKTIVTFAGKYLNFMTDRSEDYEKVINKISVFVNMVWGELIRCVKADVWRMRKCEEIVHEFYLSYLHKNLTPKSSDLVQVLDKIISDIKRSDERTYI